MNAALHVADARSFEASVVSELLSVAEAGLVEGLMPQEEA